jgi:predicted NAD/FAD-binding protein
MKLWDYDEKTLLPNLPEMLAFPNLGEFYQSWAVHLRKEGVEIRTSSELLAVIKRESSGVVVRTCLTESPEAEVTESYDELVLAVLADEASRLLGSQAGFLEKRVLGSAKFFDDITVTHNDLEYIEKYYEPRFKEELALQDVREQEQQAQIAFARNEFAPMYFTHSYEKDPKVIEMSFDWFAHRHRVC